MVAFGKKNHSYKHGHASRILGHSTAYKIWAGMIGRTKVKSHGAFNGYGGRGIKVCERWLEFCNFFSDMGNPPLGMTLDRIDTNGNYEPENCRWATAKEQANNRRNNRLVTAFGKTQTLQQWADETGLHFATIKERLNFGWSAERAVSVPPRSQHANNVMLEIFGEKKTVAEWSKICGVKYSTIRERLKRGWEPQKALSPARYYPKGKHC